MPTIAHISDLHLQSGVPERQAQVEPILQKINAMKPDLVVISGDVTDDGWDSIEELKWAKAWLDERIDGEWFAVPGNHDVGNFVELTEGVVNLNRLERWENTFSEGTIRWLTDLNSWGVVGLNSMVLGTGHQIESKYLYGILQTMHEVDSGPLAVFLHSPFFIQTPDEPNNPNASYWLGNRSVRNELFAELDALGVRFIGSGHVHQTRLTEVDGVKIAWAPPASGTWVHAPGLPNPPMPEQTGFFLHTLHDDGRVESELIACAPMLKWYEHNP